MYNFILQLDKLIYYTCIFGIRKYISKNIFFKFHAFICAVKHIYIYINIFTNKYELKWAQLVILNHYRFNLK
jgi:hypothetical protein